MIGLIGIAVLLLIAYVFSAARSSIRWRTVVGAFALQAGLGAFVLYVPLGQELLGGFALGVANVIGYASADIECQLHTARSA